MKAQITYETETGTRTIVLTETQTKYMFTKCKNPKQVKEYLNTIPDAPHANVVKKNNTAMKRIGIPVSVDYNWTGKLSSFLGWVTDEIWRVSLFIIGVMGLIAVIFSL